MDALLAAVDILEQAPAELREPLANLPPNFESPRNGHRTSTKRPASPTPQATPVKRVQYEFEHYKPPYDARQLEMYRQNWAPNENNLHIHAIDVDGDDDDALPFDPRQGQPPVRAPAPSPAVEKAGKPRGRPKGSKNKKAKDAAAVQPAPQQPPPPPPPAAPADDSDDDDSTTSRLWKDEEVSTLLEFSLGKNSDDFWEKLQVSSNKCWKKPVAMNILPGRDAAQMKSKFDRSFALYKKLAVLETFTGGGADADQVDFTEVDAVETFLADRKENGCKADDDVTVVKYMKWKRKGWFTLFHDRYASSPKVVRRKDRSSASAISDDETDRKPTPTPSSSRTKNVGKPPATPAPKNDMLSGMNHFFQAKAGIDERHAAVAERTVKLQERKMDDQARSKKFSDAMNILGNADKYPAQLVESLDERPVRATDTFREARLGLYCLHRLLLLLLVEPSPKLVPQLTQGSNDAPTIQHYSPITNPHFTHCIEDGAA
ncbi:hypothetical protein MKEN_00838000 [Mycena kentingensis (nom. inval.)]|nr:hypothetical protein MKEN_00838000 [Mycena kentingensis (nom. inval.)]